MKDIKPLNDKRQAHGYWESYWSGELWFKCTSHNGKSVGYSEINNQHITITNTVTIKSLTKEFHII